MPEINTYRPGDFCWAEVGTIGIAKTKAFYSELFGWTYDDRPAGEFGTYTIAQLQKKDVLGMYEISPEMKKMGVPPHWMSYVAVANTDATCEKAKKLGAKVESGPFDVLGVGRMAVLSDPTGAHFSIWQTKVPKVNQLMGEIGTPCWFELATKGVEKAEKFYVELFGWKVKKDPDGFYREITGSGHEMGGMMELMPQHGPVPPHWTVYFPVNDCDGDAKRATQLGGKVLAPPMDIPNVGRFAVLADPAGAAFAIIKLSFDPQKKHEQHAQGSKAPSKPTKKG